MTVYSSYHRVMKGLKESSDQNKHLSPWHSGFAVIVFNMFYFTSTAGFGAQQWPDAVTPLPAHLNQGLQCSSNVTQEEPSSVPPDWFPAPLLPRH